MKYENIKVIVVVSICIGCFILFLQIGNTITLSDYAGVLFFLTMLYAIPMTLFLFIVIPIAYLRHLNKIGNIK